MDFFKSILAEPDQDPASPPPEQDPEPSPAGSATSATPAPSGGGGGGWGFGGLLKTLTSQSETVLETYRRDLAEFSTGLRRETEVLRKTAGRDLPSSAHALDRLADIVAQGKEALSQVAAAAAAAAPVSDGGESEQSSTSGAHVRYSRFEALLQRLGFRSPPSSSGGRGTEQESESERGREKRVATASV